MLEGVLDILGAVLLVAGGAFCFSAAVGLYRLPDVFMRMHASTKAGTLGLMFIVIAFALTQPALDVVIKAILVSVFMIITAPIGSHLVGRAAFRTGAPMWHRTILDEETRRFQPPGGLEIVHLGDDGEPLPDDPGRILAASSSAGEAPADR
ncbi:MAG: monovalent cation/H(+) antiporter subunit G [Pseudomonadota bacterium]